jgi:protein tyrosine/serine phosphatase
MHAGIAKGIVVGLLLMGGTECARIFVGLNFHQVVAGRCIRSAQPSGRELESVIERFGVCTVVNLRGDNGGEAWYENERVMAPRLGARFVDAGMWTNVAPSSNELQIVVNALADAPEPIWIHCNGGNDRSGFASALYLLLRTDADPGAARGQLSLRYGHWPWGRASCQGVVLDEYERWLRETGYEHTPERLRRWAREVYRTPLAGWRG